MRPFIFCLLRIPSNSALYRAKYNSPGHQSYHQTLPLSVPENNEHLIELPSDIFTSRTGDFLD